MFYQLSRASCAERGQSRGVVSDTEWGGCEGEDTKDKEKDQRNSGGTGRDEEMWTVQPRRKESDGGKMKGEK